MLTTILIGISVILYLAGLYLMAAFIPAIEEATEELGFSMSTTWKWLLLFGWPIAMIYDAFVSRKGND